MMSIATTAKRRVFTRGVGAVSPNGVGRENFWGQQPVGLQSELKRYYLRFRRNQERNGSQFPVSAAIEPPHLRLISQGVARPKESELR
jgi:hypothetical protein